MYINEDKQFKVFRPSFSVCPISSLLKRAGSYVWFNGLFIIKPQAYLKPSQTHLLEYFTKTVFEKSSIIDV